MKMLLVLLLLMLTASPDPLGQTAPVNRHHTEGNPARVAASIAASQETLTGWGEAAKYICDNRPVSQDSWGRSRKQGC